MDRYDLYDLCVAEPEQLVRFLAAAHGGKPKVLREDFAGTAATARAWIASSKGRRAVAVDWNEVPLKRAANTAVACVVGDVMDATQRADVITATNFSLGYWHERADLLAYLQRARRCLNAGGVLVADIYGGQRAMQAGRYDHTVKGPRGEAVVSTFEQRSANPITGRVVDALHFKVRARGSRKGTEVKDAFVYDWRLWSIPELVDAAKEAGFGAVEVHDRVGVAVDGEGNLRVQPADHGEQLDADWVVYLVARR